MSKAYVVAGIVLCFILLLITWLFLGDFGNFAKRLGEGAKDAALGEQNKIIGTWFVNTSDDSITFLSNGGYTSTMMHYGAGTYIFEGDALVLTIQVGEPNGDSAFAEGEVTYNYDFLDDSTLVLTHVESRVSEIFIKQE